MQTLILSYFDFQLFDFDFGFLVFGTAQPVLFGDIEGMQQQKVIIIIMTILIIIIVTIIMRGCMQKRVVSTLLPVGYPASSPG